ncbi:glycosyltransferase family 39 protein [Pseudomonas sp. EA_65y_Pfl1_P113]|uniref:glycosyltransferase family 39 protein n=1 Tax=Pseudomonas sp. EA_65y_Pfl1_P113 TaxID=3088692 RepID=UPI0030DC90EE
MRLIPAQRSITGFFCQWWWVLAIVFFALLIRVFRLTDASVWSDEGFTLELISYPPKIVWILSGRDVHPPLYYFVLQSWVALIGSNDLVWTRGLSAIFGAINVGLGIWLTLLISTRRAALMAGVLLAVLPIAVRYSQDIRMYSMLGTFLLGATIALVYWVVYPSRKRYMVIYAVLMVAGFYTHYFSVLCACSHWLYLLLIRHPRLGGLRRINRLAWWSANVMMMVFYTPWLPSMFKQLSQFGPGWVRPIDIYSLPSAVWRFLTVNDGRTYETFVFWTLPLLYLMLAFSVLFKRLSSFRFEILLVVNGLLTVAAAALISLYTPVFVERYLFFSALMMPLIMAVALDRLKNSKVLVALLCTVLSVEGYGVYKVYNQQYSLDNPYRIADNQLSRLMQYFNKESIEGDVLVTGYVYIFYAANFYNQKNRSIRLYTPPGKDGTSGRPDGENVTAPMIKYTGATYIDRLENLVSTNGRVWLLPFTDQMQGRLQVPATWKLIRHEVGGDYLLNQYVICSPQAIDLSEVCE